MVRSLESRRERAELVVRRAEHLPPEDRAVLAAVFEDGMTVKGLAMLMGVEPRKLGRRVKRLVRRVMSDRYIFVVSHRETWPAVRRRLATASIIHGRSIKSAAAEAGTTFYNARKQLDAVNALVDSIVHARKEKSHGVTRSHPEEETKQAADVADGRR